MIRKLSLPALVVLGTLVLSVQARPQKPSAAQGQPTAQNYEVYAVRFADVPFSAGSLVAGADRARMINIAFTVWAMKGGGRTRAPRCGLLPRQVHGAVEAAALRASF